MKCSLKFHLCSICKRTRYHMITEYTTNITSTNVLNVTKRNSVWRCKRSPFNFLKILNSKFYNIILIKISRQVIQNHYRSIYKLIFPQVCLFFPDYNFLRDMNGSFLRFLKYFAPFPSYVNLGIFHYRFQSCVIISHY